MNYIKHLTGFFDKVTHDKQLNPTHVSLYIALFQFWNCNRFKNPISISRHEVMRISKISSLATYHKCLKNLHANGYIKYEPSFNPYKGSQVYLFNFADDLKPTPRNERTTSKSVSVSEQVVNKHQTSTKQVDEQALDPSINNTNKSNITNSLNLGEPHEKNKTNLDFKSEVEADQKKLRKKKYDWEIPTLEEVIAYFDDNGQTEVEASKFFNYFASIGWLVGGKTPMADWHAAANNWVLNIPKFVTTEPKKTAHVLVHKNYSEPL